MKPTSIFDKLTVVTPIQATPTDNSLVASTQELSPIISSYGQDRNNDIIQCLKGQGYDKVMIPNENELIYINSIFQNKGFHNIDNITGEVVNNIGKANFAELDTKLKQFTSAMSGVKAVGILSIMSDLSKDIDDIAFEDTLKRATEAKPTLLSSVLSLFDKNAKSKSISKQLEALVRFVKDKSGNVESKLQVMENDLRTQYCEQEGNIKTLEEAYRAYLKTFNDMRRQFGLIVYLEWSYKASIETYKQNKQGNVDLSIGQKINEYERTLRDIENRRLLIHKTMTQLPLTATQAETLINVCKNLMQEINTTLISSFPSIRGNLVNLYVTISARKAILGNELASKLENNLAMISAKSTGQLAVQTELLSADARKREVETMQKIVLEMKANKALVDRAKNQAQQIMEDNKKVLISLADDVKLLASG